LFDQFLNDFQGFFIGQLCTCAFAAARLDHHFLQVPEGFQFFFFPRLHGIDNALADLFKYCHVVYV